MEMNEPITNNVIEQMKNDILNGDWTAIYELLVLLEKDKSARPLLIDYLGIEAMQLKDVPTGTYLKRTPTAKAVYERAEYDRASKRFIVEDCSDISKIMYLKGTTTVYVGFTY